MTRGSASLVSVVVPSYNRASFLPATLDTLLNQDHERLEVLVLDDGSTDETPEVVAEYAARWGDRLRASRHDNMGQARTLNRGFEAARGEILGYLSSDDLLRPGAISRLVQAFAEEPEVVVAYPDMVFLDEAGEEVGAPQLRPWTLVDAVRLHENVVGVGALFRRSVVEAIGGWDPRFRYIADYEFWLRASRLGPFRRVPERLGCWRVHGGMATEAGRGEAMAREHVGLIDGVYAWDDVPPELEEVRGQAYRNAYVIAAVLVAPFLNDVAERFVIADTLSGEVWQGAGDSAEQQRVRLEHELRRQAVELARVAQESARGHEAAERLHHEVTRLHGEVAQREARIQELRCEAHLAHLARRTARAVTPAPLRPAARRLATRLARPR